jgi:hypothetical protein
VAFGEGEELTERTFAYQDTLFTFMDEQDVVEALPENLRLIKSETRRWREKPHGGFRTAPHTHEACFFLVERV